MTTLDKKVNCILENSDFNDLPFEERKRICKYTAETQILTIWQMLIKDKEHTTEVWRRKQRKWLENCVESYQREYVKGNKQYENKEM